MTEKITNIAKNTSYFTFALILQKIISFTYFVLIARALGPEDLGKYYFAISFTTIFATLIDLGLTSVLTREVAKTKEQTQKILSTIMAIKLPLAALVWLVVIMLVKSSGYSEIIQQLIYLSAISMVLDSFTMTFFGVIRGFHNLLFESIASVIFQFIILSVGLISLKMNLGIIWLMSGLVVASTFNFIYSSFLIYFKWGLSLLPLFDSHLAKLLVKITIPFALFAIFQRIYIYLDSVLLSSLAGNEHVGFYQISFKIIFALQFLPLAFVASLYPAMSVYWQNNREQLVITFERAMNYLIIISLPIAIGIAVLADKVILLFKSGFDKAILPLEINMLAIIFMFVGYPVGALLNACDKQKINTINMAITVVVSVILNIILIPKLQAVGASITVLITNMLMLILGFYWVPKIINYRPRVILKVFVKVILATLIMVLVILYLKNLLNIFVTIILGGLIYFAILFLLGGFKKEDFLSIWNCR
ncbi:MAG: flippase [Patescibacteria group bacterium]|nr:flippase [Patescibacteria group bacterium]MBU1870798.1 flippase [Patescibacteria group bacterium]